MLGQATFTTMVAATTQAGMRNPSGAAIDEIMGRLYVADTNNHRVMVFDVAAVTNGETATNVLGQATFTAMTGATTQAGMRNPNGVFLDPATSLLYVGDTANHRVTTYDVAAITDGENGVNVLGQVNFTSGSAAVTQGRMSSPRGLALVPPDVVVTTSITYDYDPLYRLTAADYAGGTFFHYSYDAVGNRLTEVTQAGTTNYTYDNANRLTLVNGVTNTWDNRGNMLSDGVSNYTYNRANRLTSAVQGGTTYAFAYNGLGDRLRQTINGTPTNYSVDFKGGLTQVLSDGTNAYLYGVGRLAEEQLVGWQYHLGDALGSVRQLTNSAAGVALTRVYQPFGSTISTAGSVTSIYQFTGEQRDGTGLSYLRSRYLSSATGRFLSADPSLPMTPSSGSSALWAYVGSNPVNSVDPLGLFAIDLPLNVNAGLAVLAMKALYSAAGPLRVCLLHPDDRWDDPSDTVNDLLTDFICEYGPREREFGADSHLTQQLARTATLGSLRGLFYARRGDRLDGTNWFGGGEFILATVDTLIEGDELRLDLGITVPVNITHFLGSFDYAINRTRDGQVSFRIVNDTELRSGTRIPTFLGGVDPSQVASATTLEELIEANPALILESVGDLLAKFPVIGILKVRSRDQTRGLMGGGSMRQIFVWTEPDMTCTIGLGFVPGFADVTP